MALSASTDWTATRTEIIKAAYRKVGLLSDETPPTATQLSNASFALNAIVKELEHLGPRLWSVSRETITTVSGTGAYDLDANTCGVEYVFVRENDYDYPVHLINRFEEADITDKTDTGTPSEARFIKTHTARQLQLYPVPDAVYTVYYGKVKMLDDMDSASNNPDMFTDWLNALVYLLAADLGDDYHLPMEKLMRLEQKAAVKLRLAMKNDKEPVDEETVVGSFSRRRRRNSGWLYSLVLLALLFGSTCLAAPLAQSFDFINSGVYDDSGEPLTSGKVLFWNVGLTSSKTVWIDQTRSSAAANPLTLGTGGRPAVPVYGDGLYRIRVLDSKGSTVFDIPCTSVSVGVGTVATQTTTLSANRTDYTWTLPNGQTYTTGQGKIHAYVNGVREYDIQEISSTEVKITGTLLSGWEILWEIYP